MARLDAGDLDGEKGRTLMLYGVPGVEAERVLLVGCGKRFLLRWRVRPAPRERHDGVGGLAGSEPHVVFRLPVKPIVAHGARKKRQRTRSGLHGLLFGSGDTRGAALRAADSRAA